MERYTMRLPDGLGAVPVDGYGMPELLDRLAAYEDTGLEPEDLREYLPMLREWRQNTGALRYVIELVKADADGRLQVLLCAPGAVVWALERDRTGAAVDFSGYMFLAQTRGSVVATPFVNDMEDVRGTLDYLEKDTRLNDYVDLVVYPASDCYFTREGAEAALKKEEADHADL